MGFLLRRSTPLKITKMASSRLDAKSSRQIHFHSSVSIAKTSTPAEITSNLNETRWALLAQRHKSLFRDLERQNCLDIRRSFFLLAQKYLSLCSFFLLFFLALCTEYRQTATLIRLPFYLRLSFLCLKILNVFLLKNRKDREKKKYLTINFQITY